MLRLKPRGASAGGLPFFLNALDELAKPGRPPEIGQPVARGTQVHHPGVPRFMPEVRRTLFQIRSALLFQAERRSNARSTSNPPGDAPVKLGATDAGPKKGSGDVTFVYRFLGGPRGPGR